MKSDSNFHLVPVFFQDFLKSYHYPVFFPEVVSKLYDSYFSCQGARKINNSTKEYKDNAIDQVMDNYLFYWMMNKPDTLLEKKNAFESLLNNELFPYGYTGRTKAHVTRLKTELEDFLDGSKYELFSITHNTCLDEQVLLQKTTICFLEYICNRYIAQLRSIEQQVSPTSTETVQKILDILSQLIDEMHNSPENYKNHFQKLAEITGENIEYIEKDSNIKQIRSIFQGNIIDSFEEDCIRRSRVYYGEFVDLLTARSYSYIDSITTEHSILTNRWIKTLPNNMTTLLMNVLPTWCIQEEILQNAYIFERSESSEYITEELFNDAFFKAALKCSVKIQAQELLEKLNNCLEEYGDWIAVKSCPQYHAIEHELKICIELSEVEPTDLERLMKIEQDLSKLKRACDRVNILYQMLVKEAAAQCMRQIEDDFEVLIQSKEDWGNAEIFSFDLDATCSEYNPHWLKEEINFLSCDIKNALIKQYGSLTTSEEKTVSNTFLNFFDNLLGAQRFLPIFEQVADLDSAITDKNFTYSNAGAIAIESLKKEGYDVAKPMLFSQSSVKKGDRHIKKQKIG